MLSRDEIVSQISLCFSRWNHISNTIHQLEPAAGIHIPIFTTESRLPRRIAQLKTAACSLTRTESLAPSQLSAIISSKRPPSPEMNSPNKTPKTRDLNNEVLALRKDFEEMKRKLNAIIIACAELQANSKAQSHRIVTSNYLLQALCAKLLSTEPFATDLKAFLTKLFKDADQGLEVREIPGSPVAAVPSPLRGNLESELATDQADQHSDLHPPHQEDSEVLTQAPAEARPTPTDVEASQVGN